MTKYSEIEELRAMLAAEKADKKNLEVDYAAAVRHIRIVEHQLKTARTLLGLVWTFEDARKVPS